MYNALTMTHEREDIQMLQQELRELREELVKNSSLVKKIYRHTAIANAMRFLWLAIIVGVPIVAYIFAGSFIEIGANYLNQQINSVLQLYVQQYLGK